MQSSISFNQVLEQISELSAEEQFYLSDLLQKRTIEMKRARIAGRIQEAQENYNSGNVQVGTIGDLMILSDDD